MGLAAASGALLERRDESGSKVSPELAKAAEAIQLAALGITEGDLDADRLRFSQLSSAFIDLLAHARPSRERWPSLYLFRCPMAKAVWVQASQPLANPYYGFKMSTCGNLEGQR